MLPMSPMSKTACYIRHRIHFLHDSKWMLGAYLKPSLIEVGTEKDGQGFTTAARAIAEVSRLEEGSDFKLVTPKFFIEDLI